MEDYIYRGQGHVYLVYVNMLIICQNGKQNYSKNFMKGFFFFSRPIDKFYNIQQKKVVSLNVFSFGETIKRQPDIACSNSVVINFVIRQFGFISLAICLE